MRWAVASLSPVSMTTSIPESCRAFRAAAAVSRAATARAITPATFPSTVTQDSGATGGGQLVPMLGHRGGVDVFGGHELAVAHQDTTTFDLGGGSVAGHVSEGRGLQGW